MNQELNSKLNETDSTASNDFEEDLITVEKPLN